MAEAGGGKKGASRWSNRRNERQKTFYHVKNGLIVDKAALSPEAIAAYAEHARSKSIAQFGVVKLAKYNLDVYCTTYAGDLQLLRYAAHHSPNIALALFYAGADPSFHDRAGTMTTFPTARACLMQYPPPYMAWLLLLLSTQPRSASVCGVCAANVPSMELAPCSHAVCELCFWTHLATMRVDQDLTCPTCDVLVQCPRAPLSKIASTSLPTTTAPADIAAASRALYLQLPLEPSKSSGGTKASKLVKPLPLHNAVELFVGTARSQRDANMFKAVLAINCSRLRALIAAGVEIDCQNEYGQTPLFLAAWLGYERVVAYLVGAGASPTRCDNAQTSPLDVAVAKQHTSIVQLLSSSHRPVDIPLDALASMQIASSPVFVELIAADADHPGAGSGYWDDIFPESFLQRLEQLHTVLPFAPKEKASCSDRSYYCDSVGWVIREIQARCGRDVFPNMRFLYYSDVGGYLPAHTDLSRTDAHGVTSTKTFIIYLSTCASGGETNLLSSLAPDRTVLAPVQPKRGRLLVFPHDCPHEGGRVEHVPKLLLRGEMY
ncbi:hypothetical protein SDRG_01704 [Saprolegnia diclina VS20]|uniref:RING-type domain-containing protein n=1 Tax=Saprolegnia diclina (strain VS20) TaxID=1156394 RepID=T0R0Z1_SAPDV|nr:hypothetical protein SDRG_01704 [Saprolegnia diclina VS20]EQC40621.1 hypothetical protein SDRG_01704 [Saprolegnia diclina VS20]|eukprot:XP_008605465.1 hypothetical protein SDRG_01704 [Saprolegnia diclina VS20]